MDGGVWADDYEEENFLDYYGEAEEVPEPMKRGAASGKKAILLDPNDPTQPAKPKVKKVVQNPRPKLDPDRLLLDNEGLPQLIREAYGLMYTPGQEIANLRKTLSMMERWSHRLFPKYTFKDFLDKCETLGKKRPVKTHLRKVRNGLIPT